MTSRLRSSRPTVLLLAALVAVLALVGVLLWFTDPVKNKTAIQGEPMTDAQAEDQVLASARQIIGVAQLQDVTGGYAFVSCQNETDPPYQAAVYLNFRLLHDNSVKYLRDVGASMVAHGWVLAASTGEHFGQKLTRDGVTAILYRSVKDT